MLDGDYLRQLGNINVKGELVARECELLVSGISCHQVKTGADIRLSNKLNGESVAAGGDSVSARVVGSVQTTVLGTSRIVGAQG